MIVLRTVELSPAVMASRMLELPAVAPSWLHLVAGTAIALSIVFQGEACMDAQAGNLCKLLS